MGLQDLSSRYLENKNYLFLRRTALLGLADLGPLGQTLHAVRDRRRNK